MIKQYENTQRMSFNWFKVIKELFNLRLAFKLMCSAWHPIICLWLSKWIFWLEKWWHSIIPWSGYQQNNFDPNRDYLHYILFHFLKSAETHQGRHLVLTWLSVHDLIFLIFLSVSFRVRCSSHKIIIFCCSSTTLLLEILRFFAFGTNYFNVLSMSFQLAPHLLIYLQRQSWNTNKIFIHAPQFFS